MTAAPALPRRSAWRYLLDWRALMGIAISIGLLWWNFHNEDPAEIWHELRTADPFWYLLSAAAATAVFWIRTWRWKALLETLAPGTSFKSRFAAVMIGFMGNNLLPLRAGEFARAYALTRTERVSMVGSFGSLVLERLFDGIFVVALLFVAMALPSFPLTAAGDNTYIAVARGLMVAIGAAFAVLFLLVWKPEQSVRVFEALAARLLPEKLRRPLIDALESFLRSVAVLRNPRLALRISFWSLVLWLFNAVGFYIGFRAFGIDLPFSAALFLQSAIALAVSIPSGPGFFGPFEAASRFVLVTMFGGEPALALAYAVGFHIAGFVPVTLIGLFYAWRLGMSLADVGATEEAVEAEVEAETGVDAIDPHNDELR